MKEAWEDYMRRSARKIEEISEQFEIKDWVTHYRERKWKFAGKTARQTDKRWSKLVLSWKPDHGKGRDRGRPKTIWEDEITAFVGGDWINEAQNEEAWEIMMEAFVSDDF